MKAMNDACRVLEDWQHVHDQLLASMEAWRETTAHLIAQYEASLSPMERVMYDDLLASGWLPLDALVEIERQDHAARVWAYGCVCLALLVVSVLLWR